MTRLLIPNKVDLTVSLAFTTPFLRSVFILASTYLFILSCLQFYSQFSILFSLDYLGILPFHKTAKMAATGCMA